MGRRTSLTAAVGGCSYVAPLTATSASRLKPLRCLLGGPRLPGRDAANDAADRAKALGMKAGSVLYEDMEAYNTTDGPCSGAVMSFFSGWSERLHERGSGRGLISICAAGGQGVTAILEK
ncbi:glycoside hydrolase domain-containing protein [Kibdelosporangium lantanae]|uniref:Glycoside hydrolase domain-containing protein n=1 Tax=Kibdelosporangium lantanae TaxID=1497396 RepID=A0ABW3MC52_9PSEU